MCVWLQHHISVCSIMKQPFSSFGFICASFRSSFFLNWTCSLKLAKVRGHGQQGSEVIVCRHHRSGSYQAGVRGQRVKACEGHRLRGYSLQGSEVKGSQPAEVEGSQPVGVRDQRLSACWGQRSRGHSQHGSGAEESKPSGVRGRGVTARDQRLEAYRSQRS